MSVVIERENKNIKVSIRNLFDQFERKMDFSKGFFLKPNIVFPVLSHSGEITRPEVTRALVEVIREKNSRADIVIGEGTAAGTIPLENFQVSGYSLLANELGVELLDLNKVEKVELPWKYGTIELPKIVFEKNYINLPILKLSAAAIVSGALKNQKGILSPRMKKKFHRLGLHDPIAQLANLIQPHLTILDGINFFKKDNILVAGDNAYEVDATAIRLLNIQEPEYFRIAREIGIGRDEFELSGYSAVPFAPGTYRVHKYKEYFNVRLWSNPRACSMCRLTLYNVKNMPLKDIKYTYKMYLKLMKFIITGADFVFGSKVEFSARSKNVICIGNCTKKLAEDNEYTHVPGCPPTKEEMIKYL
jgi:uncharacterized protein (DUF362 family)